MQPGIEPDDQGLIKTFSRFGERLIRFPSYSEDIVEYLARFDDYLWTCWSLAGSFMTCLGSIVVYGPYRLTWIFCRTKTLAVM